MFIKIGVLKNFASFTEKCLGWDLFLIKSFYRTPPVAASIYVTFHECFFFYFSLAALSLLPYSTVTFFVWRNTFVFMSLLLYMINIMIAEWFTPIAANATNYCTAISMIVKRISALMQFMLKQTKIPYKQVNKVQLKNILSFRCVISLICQECLISLNSVLSLTKQTQTH